MSGHLSWIRSFINRNAPIWDGQQVNRADRLTRDTAQPGERVGFIPGKRP
jgi:hypothetical protein